MRAAGFLLLPLLWLANAPSLAQGDQAVRVRAGDHPGFGRLVLDFAAPVEYRLVRDGDRVRLRFDGGPVIGAPAGHARNVLGFTGGIGEVEIVIARGARVQPLRVGNALAIDVWDPPRTLPPPAMRPGGGPPSRAEPAAPSVPASRAEPAAPSVPAVPAVATKPSAAVQPAPPAAAVTQAAPVQPAAGGPAVQPAAVPALVEPAAASPVPAAAGPLALAATARADGASVTLPFASGTGLAAFRRGAGVLLVFDERRPIDLAALRGNPLFGGASVQLLPAATVIRLQLPAGADLALTHAQDGWIVAAGPAASAVRPIEPVLTARRLMLGTDAPGEVVNVADPDTGGVLLVATERQPGAAVPAPHRTSEFVLLRTWLGIAVEPLADSVFLRPAKDGFVLGAEPGGLPLVPPSADEAAFADASDLTRRYDFPPASSAALVRRLQGEVAAAAAAPPLGRAIKRRAAAQTMIALGLGAEAQAMLQLAAVEDARAADDPDARGLAAIAALLAGRDGEAGGLDDPRLGGTDEIAFWRAVSEADRHEGSAQAASVFAATAPLLLTYPEALRDRLLPLVAETMALNGAPAADALLARRPDDPRLALARGYALEAHGDRNGALAAFDRLAAGPDRLARVRATARAAELRLADGMADAKQTADALTKLIYAWRGDRRERDTRLRVAALRAQAGEWREALALLRETEPMWPEESPTIHARMVDTFAALLQDHNADRLPPVELVTLLDENADLVPDGDKGAELAARLADRLLALDLPKRAGPVLAKLAQSTSGAVRASFGARLAALRLREDSPADALATLSATEADALPQAIQEQRTLVRAEAVARRGDPVEAGSLLAGLRTEPADELRARILEDARNWPLAEQALADYAARTVPADGALSDAQRRTLLRLAGATAQAGDAAALGALSRREARRMDGGPLGDMFRLLTESPVRGGADLPRAAKEIALARGLPSGLRAMEPLRQTP